MTFGRNQMIAAAALSLLARGACAQDISKFVINGNAVKAAHNDSEISLDTARKITQDCLDFAAAHNIAVSVFVLSPYGQIVHADRMDGQGPIQVDTALLKAQTALYMRNSTHAMMNQMINNPEFETRLIPVGQMRPGSSFWNSGGLPIFVGDKLIGAIGVGGSNMDEACAYDALTKVIGPQPPLAPTLPPIAPPTFRDPPPAPAGR